MTQDSAVRSDGIDSWLRDILRCPACRSPLTDAADDDGGAELWCDASLDPTCARQYRVEAGIPVLLIDEARHPRATA